MNLLSKKRILFSISLSSIALAPLATAISCSNGKENKVLDYETPRIQENVKAFFEGFQKGTSFDESKFKDNAKTFWNAYSLVSKEASKPNVSVALSQQYTDLYTKGFLIDFAQKSIAPAILSIFSANKSLNSELDKILVSNSQTPIEEQGANWLNKNFNKLKFLSEESKKNNEQELSNNWKKMTSFIQMISDRFVETSVSGISISSEKRGFQNEDEAKKARIFLKSLAKVIEDKSNLSKEGLDIDL